MLIVPAPQPGCYLLQTVHRASQKAGSALDFILPFLALRAYVQFVCMTSSSSSHASDDDDDDNNDAKL